MNKQYFRAEIGNLLAEGDSLTQSDHYPDRVNQTVKRAEEHLRPYHDLGDARSSSIFVFEDEKETRNYYDHSKNRHLYELNIDPADIVHRADMNWVNKIGEAVVAGDLTAADEFSNNWVNGLPTEKPRWETLVKAGKVKTVLGKAADSPANNRDKLAIEKIKRTVSDEDYPFPDMKPKS